MPTLRNKKTGTKRKLTKKPKPVPLKNHTPTNKRKRRAFAITKPKKA